MRGFPLRAAACVLLTLLATAPAVRAQDDLDDGLDADRATAPALTDAQRRALLAREGADAKLAGPVDPKQYRLGPGDRLVFAVRGAVVTQLPLEVEPEGTIAVPSVGTVQAAGRTLAEVRDEILRRARQYYRNVELQVRLVKPRTFRFYRTGRVETPGPATANGSYRVADVLAPGDLLEGASQRNIEVIHTDGTRERCDLQLFLQTGEARWNPWLRDGDVVQVPTATRFVHAEGALARPGRYELGQADSVTTLVRLAGGLLPAARAERMLVLRFTGGARPDSIWLDTQEVLEGRAGMPLSDGDRFFVYFDPHYRQLRQATVVGEVGRPGTYPIVEGQSTLRELVLTAHGLLATADSTAIRVHRPVALATGKDPELDRLLRLSRSELTASEYEVLRTRLSGMREDFSVDWARVARGGEPDLLLRDGDVVRVDRLLMSIRVDGEVRRPGLLNFVRGRSVEQCIEAAGGFTNRAWRGKVRVTRAVTGQTLLASNVQSLDPGDLIWVPERPDRTAWEQMKDVLVALSQIATIVIAIRSVK